MANIIVTEINVKHIDEMRDLIYAFMNVKDLSRSEIANIIIAALDQMAYLDGIQHEMDNTEKIN